MDNTTSILALLAAYKEAVFRKDITAFVALYDPSVCVFDMWGEWQYEGIEAWQKMVSGWFSSLGSERVRVGAENVKGVALGELAMLHGIVSYTAESADGTKLRAMENRLSWIVKKDAQAWKIIHEHTSAPVDFESSKVMKRVS